jgi:DNA-binding transcriptional LysR family regulator
MDLRQLRYFVHVAELKSLSRASAQLNVAQSALSRHMRLLEIELGVKLLERHCRGVEPTAAGQVLLRRSSTLLRSLEEARHEVMAAGRGPAGLVSLAIPPSVAQIFAGPMIQACHRQYPHITLKLSEGWTGDIYDWLLSRHCDLGILYSSQVDSQIAFKPIFSEELSLVVSAQNRSLTKRESYSLREVSVMPLVVPPQPHGLRKVIDATFTQHDLALRVAYESQIWSLIKEIIVSGLANAIMPASEVASDVRRGRMIAIPIVDPVVRRTLGIAMVRGAKTTSTVMAVYDLISREGKTWPVPKMGGVPICL